MNAVTRIEGQSGRWYRRVLTVGLGLALFASAEARGRASVVVLPIVHQGLNAKDATRLQEAALQVARRHFRSVAPTPPVEVEAMKLAAGCLALDAPCLARIARTLGASRALLVRLTRDGASVRMSAQLAGRRRSRERSLDVALVDGPSLVPEFRWRLARLFGSSAPPPAGRIALSLPDSAAVLATVIRLDDKVVPRKARYAVAPGTHEVQVECPGFAPWHWRGAVPIGGRVDLKVALTRAAPAPAPAAATPVDRGLAAQRTQAPAAGDSGGRLYTWIFAGGAVASAAVGTLFGIQVLNAEKRAEDEPCQDGQAGDFCARARRAATATYIAWPLAGVLTGLSVAAYVLEGPDDEGPRQAAGPSAQWAPWVSAEGGGLSVSGRFE